MNAQIDNHWATRVSLSGHFPPRGEAVDLNELAGLAEDGSGGFLPLDARFGVADAILNSEWLAEREAVIRADERKKHGRRIAEAIWDKNIRANHTLNDFRAEAAALARTTEGEKP